MSHKLAIIFALICIVSWSFIPVIARFGQTDLNNVQLLFLSNILSLLVIGIGALIVKKRLISLTLKEFFYCALLGGLGCFLYYALLYYGYANEHAITVLIIQYSWPVLIVLLSAFILKEHLSTFKIIGCVMGFIAIVLIITKGDFQQLSIRSPLALILVFIGALCFALFSVFSKKLTIDAFISTFWFFFFATIFSWILLITMSEFKLPSMNNLIPVLINGALINGLSYILWIKALQLGQASTIGPLVFLAPALAFVWIALFFGTEITIISVIGLGLCILSGLLCAFEKSSSS